jgi:CheY-like chemotaxis protein
MPTIAVVTELIFSTKITGTGKVLNKPVLIARTLDRLREHLDTPPAPDTKPPLVIIDLNSTGLDIIEAIRQAKAHPTAPRVIAFLSHVEVELAQQAKAAGADQVLARSGFVNQLPHILAAT